MASWDELGFITNEGNIVEDLSKQVCYSIGRRHDAICKFHKNCLRIHSKDIVMNNEYLKTEYLKILDIRNQKYNNKNKL